MISKSETINSIDNGLTIIDDRFTSIESSGIIFINKTIDGEISNYVCREIIEQNLANIRNKSIQLIINSEGGNIADAFAIIDIIKWSKIPIHALGIGEVCSSALLIFMACRKGYRILSPRTMLLSHRFFTSSDGNQAELQASRKYQDMLHKIMVNHYLKYTKFRSFKQVEKYVLREVDTWLTAEDAVKHGIADKIEKSLM